jgi:hypothetical protein
MPATPPTLVEEADEYCSVVEGKRQLPVGDMCGSDAVAKHAQNLARRHGLMLNVPDGALIHRRS